MFLPGVWMSSSVYTQPRCLRNQLLTSMGLEGGGGGSGLTGKPPPR